MAEFTPGPWKAVSYREEPAFWYVTNEAGDPSEEYDLGERAGEADIRLMAAAPDLLAACKAMNTADSSAEITAAWNLLWVAIARAEGRTP